MGKNLKNRAVIGTLVLGMTGLNSCLKVDDTYDLDKDFDMTITVGGNLTLPGSSTEKLLLGDLLELEEDGVIKANEASGDYALVQKGEAANTDINVEKVEIENLRFNGFDINLEQREPVTEIPDIPIVIDTEKIEIDITEDNITEEILDVDKAFTLATNAKFTVNLNNDELEGIIREGYTITFPEYMTIDSSEDFCEIVGGNVLRIKEDKRFISSQDVNINISCVTFGKENATFDYQNHRIVLGGDIVVNGTILLPSQKVSTAANSVNINTSVSCEMLSLERVTGTVRPKDNKNSIQIGELPDFLKGEDVTIDVTDPRIYLTVSNNTDADISLNAVLIPIKAEQKGGKVGVKGLSVPANTENYVICIHQNRDFKVDGNEVIIDNLASLIEKIPDTIELVILDITATGNGVALGEEIQINTDYELNTPLMFGSKTNINYVKTFDGWGSDLEDVEFERIEASMTVINEIPLGINLKAEAIDKDGNVMGNVKVDMNVDIDPGTIENPSTKVISFSITPTEGNIRGLDGINMIINAKASDTTGNTALNENQTMQFKDIKLGLKGGITMDLN